MDALTVKQGLQGMIDEYDALKRKERLTVASRILAGMAADGVMSIRPSEHDTWVPAAVAWADALIAEVDKED